MTNAQKVALFLLRVSVGWYFFHAGLTKVLDPAWSASGFLLNATMFPDFYAWFASPGILSLTNLLNSWGLLFIGLAILFGVGVRIAGISGVTLMLLYYFPHENTHSFIVDDHIITALALAVAVLMDTGGIYGFKKVLMNTRLVKGSPFLNKLIS